MVYPFDPTYTTPLEAGEIRLTEARVETSDWEPLILWCIKAAKNNPTILYFPGNAVGLKDHSPRFSAPIDQRLWRRRNRLPRVQRLKRRAEELTLTEDAITIAILETARPLVLYGESLGTAMVLRVAADGIGDAIVLEALFTSFLDIVAAQYPLENLGIAQPDVWKFGSGVITHPGIPI